MLSYTYLNVRVVSVLSFYEGSMETVNTTPLLPVPKSGFGDIFHALLIAVAGSVFVRHDGKTYARAAQN